MTTSNLKSDVDPSPDSIDPQLAAIVRSWSDAVVVFDRSGTIEFANESAQNLFETAVLRGRNIRQIVDVPGDWCGLTADESFRCIPVEFERSDGTTHQAEAMVRPLVVDGRESFAAVIRDLTHVRSLERKFVEAQRLEAAGALAAGIAHDFNNILMGINGTIALAERELATDHPVRERMAELHQGVDAASAISRQLLAFMRRSSASDRLFDVDAEVLHMRSLYEATVDDNVRVRFDLRAAGLRVAGDRRQLQQAVLNLVLNAQDAIEADGEIFVETRAIELTEPLRRYDRTLRAGHYVQVTVRDNGVGIAAEHVDRIFEPFFTTKELGRGTGLGLSMVYGTARGMGGLIDVESELGHGTRFEILLPAVTGVAGSLDEPISTGEYPRAVSRSRTVLVVEDNPFVARTVELFLQEDGHTVVHANSLAEATRVVALRGSELEVLLCDAVLSDGFGADVARMAQQRAPDIAIVFMSAHPRGVLIDHDRILDGPPCLHKPFDALELRRALLGAERSRRTPRRRKQHVMLIDDHAPSIVALATVLSDSGVTVSTAMSCRQARAIWDPQSVDVVVTDLRLPDGSGSELAREFLEQKQDLRVIYMSGLPRSTVEEDHHLAADIEYLEKPYDIDRLCAMISNS